MIESALGRFLRYVNVNTQSMDDATCYPSTPCQWDLAKMLEDECKNLGLIDVNLDQNGYVTAKLKASKGFESCQSIAFIAHMDTSPAVSGENVKPQMIDSYDGCDILLNNELNIILSSEEFPQLKQHMGKQLVTTDGTTLLGADNKAGIAIILTAMEHLIEHPELPHGEVLIAFTPDEEVGNGVAHFDSSKFKPDFGYTMDGGLLGGFECECFNAASSKITISGKSIHTGSAYGKMVNASLLAAEFITKLPPDETPAVTQGYSGFYHLCDIKGDVEKCVLNYILRDFELSGLCIRKQKLQEIANEMNEKLGFIAIEVKIKEQYRNMMRKIMEHPHVLQIATTAMKNIGITPIVTPIRGGTDGAALTHMEGGFPCPNIFTGGANYHSKYEYLVVDDMIKSIEVVLEIIKLSASHTCCK